MRMVGIVFSNIYDATMGELTKRRTVASLPFGGRYRQIDFVLSNMVNSDIASIGVITKYNYQSLMDHLSSSSEWDLNRKTGGLYILPPFSTGHTGIYRGKIEALYGALSFLKGNKDEYVLLCDSPIICNIDYDKVLDEHIKSKKDITVIANRAAKKSKYDLVLDTEKNNKVVGIAVDATAAKDSLIGMGMFIMKREELIDVIEDSVSRGLYHFEKDFLQKKFMDKKISINVYEFSDYVLRNRDVVSYYENNLKLMDEDVRNSLFNVKRPIYTKVRDEVPTRYGNQAKVDDCIVADGCTIHGNAENSVIFRDVRIGKGSIVKNSIIFQGTSIGENAIVENAIIDKDAKITDGTTLIGAKTAPIIINKNETV